jgi:glutaminase
MRSPVTEYLEQILQECGEDDGAVADYIPELAAADPTPLAVALCTPDGTLYTAGEAERRFSIQSISKPFAYAMALQEHGIDAVLEKVGVEPSGDAFNEISLEESTGRPENPMINIGAITTHTLVGDPDMGEQARTALVLKGMGEFAGRDLEVDEDVFASEMSEIWRNLALASLVRANSIISETPEEAVRGYTRQCAALVDVRDLAVMGMTLARGGVNPLTGRRVVSEEVSRQVLSVMATCGMYDAAGDWLSTVGIPAKSGVAGGVMGALPGQVGAGTFSPRLDRFGNSVRGVKVFERLSHDMDLHLMRLPSPSLEVIGQRERTLRGRRLVVLQGSMDFASAEMALRHFEQIEPEEGRVVVDLRMVPSINDVGARMLHEGLSRLADDGHEVTVVDPHGRLGGLGDRPFPYVARIVADRDAE